jgi:hypothetical protein
MMNRKEILKKVGGIVSELKEQHEYLSQSPDNLNELELELFLANAHFLSDHIAILVKLNGNLRVSNDISGLEIEGKQSPIIYDIQRRPEAISNEEKQDTKSENISDLKLEIKKEPDLNFEFERKGEATVNNFPLNPDENLFIEEETTLKTEAVKENNKEAEYKTEHGSSDIMPVVKEVIILERTVALPVQQIVSDNPPSTINELLSQNASQQTLGSQFSSRQVGDLKSMISLNDKLLFIRDLFNSYSLAYSEAIELLNRFDSMEAAENFLKQNYALKNNWEDKQDAADKFYELLSRRFAK